MIATPRREEARSTARSPSAASPLPQGRGHAWRRGRSSGCGGGRWVEGPQSRSLGTEAEWGQEHAPPDTVSRGAEADKSKGKPRSRHRNRTIRSFNSSLGSQPPRASWASLLRAPSRALRRPLSRTTLSLSTPDANKDLFFKQTGSVYGGRAGG